MKFNGLIARFYDSSFNIFTFWKINNIREDILSLIPKGKKLKVLEIGCGTGSQLIKIKKELSVKCYGIDISQEMLNLAKRKAETLRLDIHFSKQDFTRTKFKRNSFDIIIASLALHEVDLDTQKKAVKEIARLLKKDGNLIILDFIKPRSYIGKVVQTILFVLFEEHAKEFIEYKDALLNTFRKKHSKKRLGILAIEMYSLGE